MEELKLTFVNVGYGEAALLECPDPAFPGGTFVMVIDGGSAEAEEYRDSATGRIPLDQYLSLRGVDHIDLMAATHVHEDHLCGLLPLCAQLLQAEIQCPADLFRVGAAHLAAQGIHRRHQLFAGILGAGQVQRIFLGQLGVTEAPGAFGKFCPPRRSIGRPRVGIVFQRTDFRLGQVAQAGLGQHCQLLGHIRAPQ